MGQTVNLLLRLRRFESCSSHSFLGEMAEWSIVPHSKCGIQVTVSRVRIPVSPHKDSAGRHVWRLRCLFFLRTDSFSRRLFLFSDCRETALQSFRKKNILVQTTEQTTEQGGGKNFASPLSFFASPCLFQLATCRRPFLCQPITLPQHSPQPCARRMSNAAAASATIRP